MIADRRSPKVCDRVRSYGNILLRSSAILRSRSQTIAADRIMCYLLRSSAIICDQLRLCDHMETKVLGSAIKTHPIIFRVLSHDSTLVCSIVGTVCVATLISLSSWLRLNMFVTRNLSRKLHVMNVFTIAEAKILKTIRTKRPTVGTKSGRSLGQISQQKNCVRSLSNPKPMFSTVLVLTTTSLHDEQTWFVQS